MPWPVPLNKTQRGLHRYLPWKRLPRGGKRDTEPPFYAFSHSSFPLACHLPRWSNLWTRTNLSLLPSQNHPKRKKKKMPRVEQQHPLKRCVLQEQEQRSQVNNHLKDSFFCSLTLLIVIHDQRVRQDKQPQLDHHSTPCEEWWEWSTWALRAWIPRWPQRKLWRWLVKGMIFAEI